MQFEPDRVGRLKSPFPLHVYRGFRHNGLSMTGLVGDALGRRMFKDVFAVSDLDPNCSTMFPLAANGMWNCAPRGDEPGLMFELLAEGAKDHLEAGNMYLCLDAAGEGFPLETHILQHMEEQLKRFGLAKDRVVYLTSDLKAKDRYARWLNVTGMREAFTPVSFDMQLYYLSGVYRKNPNVIEKIYINAINRYNGSAVPNKKFLSFNYTPRPHRIALVLHFFASGLLDQGAVSFHGLGVDNGPVDSGWQDPAAVEQWLVELGTPPEERAQLYALNQKCPIVLEDRDRFSLAYDVGDSSLYAETCFSVITESVFQDDDSELRFTEKVYKAIANAHPFILLGNPGSLRMLRAKGFKTFSTVIDESYDDIVSPRERLEAIKKEVARLCSFSIHQWGDIYRDLWPSIIHNFSMFHVGAGPLLEQDDAMLELARIGCFGD